MYYVESLKQEEIGNALGLSRIKVTRLLAAARDEGVVKIDIHGLDGFREDLTIRLMDRFGLQEVHIVPKAASSEAAVATVGFAVGTYLNEVIQDGMTIGVASGRTAHALMEGLRVRQLPSLDVVGLKGCVSHEGKTIPYETVARLAFTLGANAYQIAAPSYARSHEEHALFKTLPMIANVLDRAGKADIAILTSSRVANNGGLVEYGFVTREEIQELRKAGAVAAMLGNFIDARGKLVEHDLNSRQIGLGLDALKSIASVVLTGAGSDKVEPLNAALRAGIANVLFTDEDTAKSILAMERP
ncbi:sugar-binding transcriptional regulator [Brucellaceae bacterium D45D]